MPSFDVVSKVDPQEIDNAVNQARKEIGQRYDFKGTRTTIELEPDTIRVVSDDDFKVKAVVDILQSKLVRRGVSLKALVYGKIEPAAGGLAKQTMTIQQGIDTDKARHIVKLIKDSKLKVQSQIQGDQVRVSGKKRDDLQAVIQLLKAEDLSLPLQFTNLRD
jgi:cyclic-di-GMP-binding protein